MAISNFLLRPETATPSEYELLLPVGAQIDYEVAAQRVQRGLLVCNRTETSSVTAKEITRGFKLDVTQVDEAVSWTRDLPVVTLRETNALAALFDTVEFDFYASDPEGNSFAVGLGAVPAGITAVFGVDDDARDLTITYPAQTSNPSSNLSYAIPVWLEQPLGTKIAGSDRTLMVRVLRYAPQGIHTSYSTPANPGRLYIDRTADHFELTLNNFIQNHSNRPLRVGRGTSFSHSWSDTIASYVITESSGVFSFRGDRVSPYPGGTRTSNIAIRVQTNDNGDTSTAFINFLLRVEEPPPSS